jgi:hypothetical protein
MKFAIARLPLLLFCCGAGTLAAQERTTFAEPAQYCFQQTALRGTPDKTILEHHLLVNEDDHFKIGDVFVIARFHESPDTIWLTDGLTWKRLNEPGPMKVYRTHGQLRDVEILQPVMPVSVFYTPRDVTQVAGGAQILVGYGLRADGENPRVAFDEMVANERYDLLWDTTSPGVGVQGLSYHICLETSAMTKEILTASVGPVVVGPVSQIVPNVP